MAITSKAANRRRLLLTLLCAYCLYATVTGWRYSPIGHIVRFACGEPEATQTANDLGDEIERIGASRLQNWAVGMLRRYNDGSLKLGSHAHYRSEGDIDIQQNEIPSYVRHAWLSAPEVSIRLSHATKAPECVVLSWSLYGVLIGPPDYTFPEAAHHAIFYKKAIIPGLYVYYVYR
ncbi:MAG TPA: hypothetical protein VGK19_09350 [Capsulimonadaceae bacterium]|jgi:hypothetical protein